jgi:hypothetical protein
VCLQIMLPTAQHSGISNYEFRRHQSDLSQQPGMVDCDLTFSELPATSSFQINILSVRSLNLLS